MDPERQTSGPYVSVEANPDKNRFYSLVQQAQTTILDVGCGETNPSRGIYPRCSWKTPRGVLWVGCDPLARSETDGLITVYRGETSAKKDQMIMFSKEVRSLPIFHPDIISVVAPNPYDLEEILEQTQNFLKTGTVVILLLEKRTVESQSFHSGVKKQIIENWAGKNKMTRIPQDELDRLGWIGNFLKESFKPNSADLGASGNTWYILKKK